MGKLWSLLLNLAASAALAGTIAEWPNASTNGYCFTPGKGSIVKPCTGYVQNVEGIALSGGVGQRSFLLAPALGLRCDLTNSFTVEGWFPEGKGSGRKILGSCRGAR